MINTISILFALNVIWPKANTNFHTPQYPSNGKYFQGHGCRHREEAKQNIKKHII